MANKLSPNAFAALEVLRGRDKTPSGFFDSPCFLVADATGLDRESVVVALCELVQKGALEAPQMVQDKKRGLRPNWKFLQLPVKEASSPTASAAVSTESVVVVPQVRPAEVAETPSAPPPRLTPGAARPIDPMIASVCEHPVLVELLGRYAHGHAVLVGSTKLLVQVGERFTEQLKGTALAPQVPELSAAFRSVHENAQEFAPLPELLRKAIELVLFDLRKRGGL